MNTVIHGFIYQFVIYVPMFPILIHILVYICITISAKLFNDKDYSLVSIFKLSEFTGDITVRILNLWYLGLL